MRTKFDIIINNVTAAAVDNYTQRSPLSSAMEETRKFSLAVNLVAYCYIMPTIAAVGILGNVANLMTLANPRLKAVSYMYLRALGIADLLCMCFVLVFVLFEILKAHHYEDAVGDYSAVWYRAHLMLPLINVSISAGILTVVALTVERYISICWPILFREWNSPRRAASLILCAYVIPFILYIPMTWQMEVVPRNNCGGGRNQTATSSSHESSAGVDENCKILYKDRFVDNLLQSTSYQAYKWTRETMLKFIPIISLTILNLQIILTFRKVRKRRQRLTTNQNGREQRSLLILLAGIVILFFTCNIPAAINLVFISEETKKLYGYVIFRATANIMEITNHALNFYVFCLCSADYRQSFLQTFPLVKNFTQSTNHLRRRMSEKKSFNKSKSTIITNSSLTSSNHIISSGKNHHSNSHHHGNQLEKLLKKSTNSMNTSSLKKQKVGTNEKKFYATNNDAINDEECQPMTKGTSAIVEDNDQQQQHSAAGFTCGYATVLINGNTSAVVVADCEDEDEQEGQQVKRSTVAKETLIDGIFHCNQQQLTSAVIVNEYCLCDEGADDVSL